MSVILLAKYHLLYYQLLAIASNLVFQQKSILHPTPGHLWHVCCYTGTQKPHFRPAATHGVA